MEGVAVVAGLAGVIAAGLFGWFIDHRRRVGEHLASAFSEIVAAVAKSAIASTRSDAALQAEAMREFAAAKAIFLVNCNEAMATALQVADSGGFDGDDPGVRAAVSDLVSEMRRYARRQPLQPEVIETLLYGRPQTQPAADAAEPG